MAAPPPEEGPPTPRAARRGASPETGQRLPRPENGKGGVPPVPLYFLGLGQPSWRKLTKRAFPRRRLPQGAGGRGGPCAVG